MTTPSKLILRDAKWEDIRRALQTWIDSVQVILTRGVRVADQVAAVKVVRWNSDSPPSVSVSGAARPLAVVCLAAVEVGATSDVVSTPRVTWSWATTRDTSHVVISDVDGLTASTDYDLSIIVLEG